MALVVPNEGEVVMFKTILNVAGAAETLKLRLYTNAHSPGEADVYADYTEVSGSGYSAGGVTLTNTISGGTWTITPGDPTTASYAQITFTFTANLVADVVGYYVVQPTATKLMWAEEFTDGPYNIANNGDQIKITLQITLE